MPGQLCRAQLRRQGPPPLRGRGDALGAKAAVQSAAAVTGATITSRTRRRSWCQGSCAERSCGDMIFASSRTLASAAWLFRERDDFQVPGGVSRIFSAAFSDAFIEVIQNKFLYA